MEAMKEATDASKPKIADTAVAIGPLIVSCGLKKECTIARMVWYGMTALNSFFVITFS